jgi:hypothetical protein
MTERRETRGVECGRGEAASLRILASKNQVAFLRVLASKHRVAFLRVLDFQDRAAFLLRLSFHFLPCGLEDGKMFTEAYEAMELIAVGRRDTPMGFVWKTWLFGDLGDINFRDLEELFIWTNPGTETRLSTKTVPSGTAARRVWPTCASPYPTRDGEGIDEGRQQMMREGGGREEAG